MIVLASVVGAMLMPVLAGLAVMLVFVMMDVPDPEFMQKFGLRPDIKKAREDAGADVSSTTVITPIGDYWLG